MRTRSPTSVEKGEAVFGILLCGTGNGVCMTANKHQGIRAAMCWDHGHCQTGSTA